MFRNMCEKAREVNEEFLARAKKIYGDDDDDDDDHDDDARRKRLRSRVYTRRSRGPRCTSTLVEVAV